MVSGDKQKNLISAIKQLDKAVDEMHHAAEDKDASKAGLGLKKIKGLLPLIQAQYPAGTLN
jgi:basic membrane lipoprotein Med (substrate-binding protein (PBP1-ABC) superfamily)